MIQENKDRTIDDRSYRETITLRFIKCSSIGNFPNIAQKSATYSKGTWETKVKDVQFQNNKIFDKDLQSEMYR